MQQGLSFPLYNRRYQMSQLADSRLYEKQAELCKVFSNANRLMILELLQDGEEYTVSEIEEIVGIPQPTISQHLKVMRDQDVVERRKEGVRSFYTLTDDRIREGMQTMRTVLLDQLDGDIAMTN